MVNYILEKNNLFNSDNNGHNFSELQRRLKVEVKARLALVPTGTTFEELVNAIIDQIEITKFINNTKQN